MPFVAPFNGLRYDLSRVGSLAKVVTPPYDIISPEAQDRFYRVHPWNFIRVVFGKGHSSDDRKNNRYQRAKITFEKWIREGILKMDAEPSLYPYQQRYRMGTRWVERWGVITLVRLDSPRIYRHEEIRKRPQQDRLELIKAVQASLSPIFGLIPDSRGGYRRFITSRCRRVSPLASFTIDGVRHRFWRISDPVWIKKFSQQLRSKPLIIADGHHRFEAAVVYRKSRGANQGAGDPYSPDNYAMFYLTPVGAKEPGLLPTHRVLSGLKEVHLKRFFSQVGGAASSFKGPNGVVPGIQDRRTLQDRLRRLQQQGRIGIGVYRNPRQGMLLKMRRGAAYSMDVEWLHQEIFPHWVPPEAEVSYTQDLAQGLGQLRDGKAQLVFVMQPPRLKQVLSRAVASKRMPGKTTYFYPKPLAGLVEYLFELKG